MSTTIRLSLYFAREALACAWLALLGKVRNRPIGYVWVNLEGAECTGCGRVHRYYTLGCDGHDEPKVALFPPPIGEYPPRGGGKVPFWREPPHSVWLDVTP